MNCRKKAEGQQQDLHRLLGQAADIHIREVSYLVLDILPNNPCHLEPDNDVHMLAELPRFRVLKGYKNLAASPVRHPLPKASMLD